MQTTAVPPAAAGEATSAAAAAAVAPVVDALLACPLTGLGAAALQQRIVAVVPQAGRLQGWLRAAEAELNVVCGGQLPTDDGERSLAGWLADVRHDNPSAVGRDLRTSTALRALPKVVDAVLDGVLTPTQAAVLSRLVGRIDHDALVASQDDLVLVAAGRDPAELAVWVRHQIATHCEPALEAEAERGRDRRFLQHSRDADGTLRGRFVIPAEDGETILTVLEPLARKQGAQDIRTAGQRRADALVDVCEQALRHGDLPDHGGARPQLCYVLPADWAAAQAARVSCTDCGPRCPDHQAPTPTPSPHPYRLASPRRARVTPAMPGQCRLSTPARSRHGPDRRPGRGSRPCCAMPASVGCCSTPSDRSRACSPCETRSPPANAASSPRGTWAASSVAAPVHLRCATPTTCLTRRRRPDRRRQSRPALPEAPRPVAPRQDRAAPPRGHLAPRRPSPGPRVDRRPVHLASRSVTPAADPAACHPRAGSRWRAAARPGQVSRPPQARTPPWDVASKA